jgi:hypothetical protein
LKQGVLHINIGIFELECFAEAQARAVKQQQQDRLQLKANGRSFENRKLVNGELVTVKTVHSDGRIALVDGRVLDKKFRQFVRGYAITSYASQGKSVDHVLFSDSLAKAATSQQQWHVTISRGKKGIHIFTSDKEQLRENITRSADQPSVMDLLAAHYQNDWFYCQIEQRWGRRAAVIMTQKRRAGKCEARRLNQKKIQGEVVGQKNEPDEMQQKPAQQQAQSQTETVGQKVELEQIQAEAPKKKSRGMRV